MFKLEHSESPKVPYCHQNISTIPSKHIGVSGFSPLSVERLLKPEKVSSLETQCLTSTSCLTYSIYVDIIFNHMCGIDGSSGTGSGGSYYDTATLEFPQYSWRDFNCCNAFGSGNCESGATCWTGNCGVYDYGNPQEVLSTIMSNYYYVFNLTKAVSVHNSLKKFLEYTFELAKMF